MRLNDLRTASLLFVCALLFACGNSSDKQGAEIQTVSRMVDGINTQRPKASLWPVIHSPISKDQETETKIDALLERMTLRQKVAQMIQPEIRNFTVEDMRHYGFGSYLNGGGAFPNNDKHATVKDWVNLAEAMYQASMDDSEDGIAIPTMWGTDAVHGHNNVIGATLFPHNIGLGATREPQLIEAIARATAKEVMATGIDWVFAPTVATVRDDRWGRTYESYSENPELVKSYAAAIVRGLQGSNQSQLASAEHVISTVKHFVGDGGTEKGDDQGNNTASEAELFKIHAQGYVGGLNAGAQTVMASFNSWQGKKVHGSYYLLTEVLKKRMGFDGLVVGDWNGHGQVEGCTNESCAKAINAGVDIIMVPSDWKAMFENTLQQVEQGVISMERIDDAVRRILRVKFRAGLFTKASPSKRPLAAKESLIGHPTHRALARKAVRESLVLLKNKNHLLPISPKLNILVAGDGADNIGKQSGGWSVTWQGTGNQNSDFPGATSIYQGIAEQVKQAGGQAILSPNGKYDKKPDIAIVVFGENPYAEGQGDRSHLAFSLFDKNPLKLLKKLKSQGIPTVSVFITGRPLWVNPELNQSDAFVVAWLPGTEGGGIADVLLKTDNGNVQYDFSGKLPFSWPKRADQFINNLHDADYDPLFAYDFGLTYQANDNLSENLDETLPATIQPAEQTPVYQGQLKAPWQFVLQAEKQTKQVNANSAVLGQTRFRTIDRFVQEDAVNIRFAQNKYQALVIQGDTTTFNMADQFSASGFLELTLRVNGSPTSDLFLGLGCYQPDAINKKSDCYSEIKVTDPIKSIAQSGWQKVSVPLACFSQSALSYRGIKTPFLFASKGKLDMDLFEVIFTDKQSDGVVQVQCSNPPSHDQD